MRLSAFEERIGAVVGGALLPTDDPQLLLAASRRGTDLGRLIGAQVEDAPVWTALGLRLALVAVFLAPMWRLGRLTTLGRLPRVEQEELLELLLKDPRYLVRQTLSLLKLFFCMAYFGDRAVLTELGAYDLAPQGLAPLRRARP